MRVSIAALASVMLFAAAPARADNMRDAVEAYALYQTDVSALLDADIGSADAVNSALRRISRHDPDQVARGWIAYGALVAAQSPAFAAGVQRQVRNDGRGNVIAQLRGDPGFARRAPAGANEAIRLILSAAASDSARAANAGARYDHVARTRSAESWRRDTAAAGLTRVSLTPAMRERLNVGALAATPLTDAEAFGGRRFWDSLAGREVRAPRARGAREQASHAAVTDRMLTVAALVVANASTRDRSRMLDEPITRSCLEMQQLQLRQCLSVAHDAGENAYCLGHHGLTGPGQCFSALVR